MNDLVTKSTWNGKKTSEKTRKNIFARLIYFLFYVFAAYLVIPLIDVPLLGLSLSAPIFFFIATFSILRPTHYWFKKYSRWIILAIILWIGIFSSTWANGLLSSGLNLQTNGILTVIRYIYWLIVFVVTAFFAAQGSVLRTTSSVLGWSVLLLAVIRWGEVAFLNNDVAGPTSQLMTQNGYGFLFSVFSPFLLMQINQKKKWIKLVAVFGNLILWGAAAINGSRGSWVAILSGLIVCIILLAFTQPKRFMGFLFTVLFIFGMAVTAWFALPSLSNAVETRFESFQNLETDKSVAVRELMVQKGWRLFLDSPLIGVGANRFTQSSTHLDIPRILLYENQTYFDRKSSHNSYINFLAEYGLLGTIPFTVLVFALFKSSLASSTFFTRKGVYWPLAVFLSLTQMSIHMAVIAALNNTGNWFIYGLAAASFMVYQSRKNEKCA